MLVFGLNLEVGEMRSKIVSLLAAAFSLALIPAASAADMPTKAPMAPIAVPYNWTGIYAGISGGMMWNQFNWTNSVGTTTGSFTGNGAVFGGTLGGNWQFAGTSWVVGVEGDWSWANSKATTITACGGTCETDVRWLATLRGRVGYAVLDRLLVYGTGGAAWAKFSPSIGALPGFVDYTQSGWTAGGGLE
jgi:outer membrane immunogenic protein